MVFFLFQGGNVLGFIFEKLISIMVVYFVVSIVNSMAQSYAKRVDEQGRNTIHCKTKSKWNTLFIPLSIMWVLKWHLQLLSEWKFYFSNQYVTQCFESVQIITIIKTDQFFFILLSFIQNTDARSLSLSLELSLQSSFPFLFVSLLQCALSSALLGVSVGLCFASS